MLVALVHRLREAPVNHDRLAEVAHRMFAGLISRWTIPRSCACATAWAAATMCGNSANGRRAALPRPAPRAAMLAMRRWLCCCWRGIFKVARWLITGNRSRSHRHRCQPTGTAITTGDEPNRT